MQNTNTESVVERNAHLAAGETPDRDYHDGASFVFDVLLSMKKRMVFWGGNTFPFPLNPENPKFRNPKRKSFAFCWSFWEHEESQKKIREKKKRSLF